MKSLDLFTIEMLKKIIKVVLGHKYLIFCDQIFQEY